MDVDKKKKQQIARRKPGLTIEPPTPRPMEADHFALQLFRNNATLEEIAPPSIPSSTPAALPTITPASSTTSTPASSTASLATVTPSATAPAIPTSTYDE